MSTALVDWKIMTIPPCQKFEIRYRRSDDGGNIGTFKHSSFGDYLSNPTRTRGRRQKLRFKVLLYVALGLLDCFPFAALALECNGAIRKMHKKRCQAQNLSNSVSFICRKSTSSKRSLNSLSPEISLIPAQFSPPSKLYMSSIRKEPEQHEAKWKIKLPPPPEDQINLSGDVAFIFFFTFLDHMVSKMYDSTIKSPAIISAASALTAIDSFSAASTEYSGYETTVDSLPVWFDTLNNAPFGNIPLTAALPIEQHIAYTPAIDPAGLSAVLFTSTWLFCGYFTGAFQLKNTLQCSTRHAISITAKTCFFTSILMVLLALGSDYLVGSMDCLHKSVGLTKADIVYIFDCVSVLLSWRFATSAVLGYGDDSGK